MTSNPDLSDRLVRLHPTADGVVVAVVTGELDLFVSPAVRRRLVEASGPQVDLLLVDLDEVALLSGAGIGMLLDVLRLAGDRGTTVRLVSTSRVVLRPLAITGDGAHLPLFPSQAAALGA
ncbi:STAS domain-containing protein [uncultured Jatrophihabitans sp.]|uniref:STAS domain-containing protein n=1 Tax=uncultured Jatrophihabitans sp. TaxID=1610747 RepID=UPI0035CC08FA